MDEQQVQQFLRQQIAFARLHCRQASTDVLPARRASIQACLLCLDLGLSRYFAHAFELTGSLSLRDFCDHKNEFQEHHDDGGRKGEICNLFRDETTWLMCFARVCSSLTALPVKTVQEHAEGLIASSNSTSSGLWYELEQGQLQFFLESAQEMLDHHIQYDIEQ